MSKVITIIRKNLSDPARVLAGGVIVSAFALAAAYTAQFAFGMEPCTLCLYQRLPFALVIVLGGIGLVLKNRPAIQLVMIAGSALAFLINSAIALYHSGVERHWWQSALEGCKVSFDEGGSAGGLLDAILKAPAVPCDTIPWADPLFGLSMANYNAMMCLGLFGLLAAALVLGDARRAQGQQNGA